MKHGVIKSSQPLGIIVVVVAALIWLGNIYQVGAAPPTPGEGLISLPTPSPAPAIDIQTKLQPYQTSELKPSQADSRLLQEATLPPEAQKASVGALAQQTFNAVADATVLQGYPTLNFGNTTDMWAGYDDSLSPDGRIVRSLMRFNLTTLPPGQIITRATLRVYLVNSWDFPNTYRTITTYRVTANWSESSATWTNVPGFGSAYSSKSIRNDDFAWHDFEVTNLVAAWYYGTYPNYGLMLRGPEISGPDSSWRGFGTREGPKPPQLVIEYSTPAIINPPSNLTGQPISKSQINLAWQDNSSNEIGFKIERSPNGTTGWTQIATVAANVTTHANTGLSCGTTYFYRVRAYSASGDSTYSNTANTITSDCSYSMHLPVILKNWSPPTPPPGPIRFVGTTNQGRSVDLDIKPDLSAVTRFRLDARVECPGVTSESAPQISNPTGWPITNRKFEIRTSAGGGKQDVFAGEFDPTFSSAQGTWLRWIVIFDQPKCNNTGTWSASRQ
jgi:hypothetical protein